MRLFFIILSTCLFFRPTQSKKLNIVKKTVHFEIIVCSYNNERWCIKNLESILDQTYPYWHATIVVDAATDSTYTLLKESIEKKSLQEKITLILNKKRQGSLANIYMVAHECPGNKVIGLLDGDDWFADSLVLERVAKVYQEDGVWLTFGQFEFYPSGKKGWARPYPKSVIKSNNFRKMYNILPTHFKTFYAELFHKITVEDLLYQGEFYPVAGDIAMMFPLIEMAGFHHRFIPEINYIYNSDNPLNDFNTQLEKQLAYDYAIRQKEPYKAIKKFNVEPLP